MRFKKKYVIFQMVKNYCKIISGYILIETTMFVSHGNILTLLEIQVDDFKMVKHLQYEYDIQEIYRQYSYEHSHNDIGVILRSGEIFTLSTPTPKFFSTWETKNDQKLTVPGGHFLKLARDFKTF